MTGHRNTAIVTGLDTSLPVLPMAASKPLSIRLTPEHKAALQAAADAAQLSLTEFIVRAARDAAVALGANPHAYTTGTPARKYLTIPVIQDRTRRDALWGRVKTELYTIPYGSGFDAFCRNNGLPDPEQRPRGALLLMQFGLISLGYCSYELSAPLTTGQPPGLARIVGFRDGLERCLAANPSYTPEKLAHELMILTLARLGYVKVHTHVSDYSGMWLETGSIIDAHGKPVHVLLLEEFHEGCEKCVQHYKNPAQYVRDQNAYVQRVAHRLDDSTAGLYPVSLPGLIPHTIPLPELLQGHDHPAYDAAAAALELTEAGMDPPLIPCTLAGAQPRVRT